MNIEDFPITRSSDVSNEMREQILKNRKLWVAFLKSGLLQKETGILENAKHNERRCCLGHACYLFGAKRVEMKRNQYRTDIIYDQNHVLLPTKIARALNIMTNGSFENPIYVPEDRIVKRINNCLTASEGYAYNISVINDCTDYSPEEIGEIIKEQFKTKNFIPYYFGS